MRLSFDSGAETTAIFRPVAVRLGLKFFDPSSATKPAPGESPVGRTDPFKGAVTGVAQPYFNVAFELPVP